jgi:hypothetical protein
MQAPLKYISDCTQLVGYVINHVPWIETNQMVELCKKTNDIWKAEFNNDMTTDHLFQINHTNNTSVLNS